jgi:hypothetical protein
VRAPGTIDRHVPHAGRLDPLADRVFVLGKRVVELPTLDVDRLAGEEVVAAAVVEVEVRVDDDLDAGEVEVLLVQWTEAGIEVGHRRVQLLDPGVDQHASVGMVDDVDVERHPLVLGEQVGDEDRRNADRGPGIHVNPVYRDRRALGAMTPQSCAGSPPDDGIVASRSHRCQNRAGFSERRNDECDPESRAA